MSELHELQKVQPWDEDYLYSPNFQGDPRPYKHFQHALTHVVKAAGNLSAVIDDLDHGRIPKASVTDIEHWIADLVNCAMRMANTHSVPFNLWEALLQRIDQKNGTDFYDKYLKDKQYASLMATVLED